MEKQLTLIRIYIGLNFIYNFSGKYIGFTAYNGSIHYFASIGLSHGFVILAGLCEIAAFIGFTFGLFTRFAAVGSALYLLLSLFLGFHHLAGFSWDNHADNIMINGSLQSVYGGWEYPLFWAFICFTFVISGGGKWSLDKLIKDSTKNKILNFLCK